MRKTRCSGTLYETSDEYGANSDNLQHQLQKSINLLVNQLKDLCDNEWYGAHFINIRMIKNNTVVNMKDDETRKLKATHKTKKISTFDYEMLTMPYGKLAVHHDRPKIETTTYTFNDDDDDDDETIKMQMTTNQPQMSPMITTKSKM